MKLICFIGGLLIIAVSIGFAIKNRHNTKKWIANITVGIFFSTLLMIFPTFYDGQNNFYHGLYAFASSLFYSFKALAGRADLAQLDRMAFEGGLQNAYIVVNEIAFIAAPVMASSLLLSFFGDTLQRLRYWLRISRKCCVFSELNENAMALAESIKQERGLETIVFCGTKGANEKLIEKARKKGGILLYKSADTLKPSWRFGAFAYYLISETEDNNIQYAESIIDRENQRKRPRRNPPVVNTFFKTSTKIEALEDLADSEKVQLRFINEISLFCNDLLFKHPLYCDLPKNRKQISVMIVGCGSWGMQMLKTVISNGQIDGYSLKIRVYDIQAGYRKTVFYRQCPELKTLGVDLEFIQTDVQTEDFLDKIRENSSIKTEDMLDVSYVCVATSSDDTNIQTAEALFRFFSRENGFDYTPPIFTRIKNDISSNNMSDKNKSYLEKRKIELFGTAKSFYADKTLFNTRIEKLALGTHLIYWSGDNAPSLLELFEKDAADKACRDAVQDFFKSNYSRRSSMAVALHFGAKVLIACGKEIKSGDISKDVLKEYQAAIAKPGVLDRLIRNEHKRWNYFMATEGFQHATPEELEKLYPQVHKHKDEEFSKLHTCIIPFDQLSTLDAHLNKLEDQYCHEPWFKKKHDPFQKYDERIVTMLPQIMTISETMRMQAPGLCTRLRRKMQSSIKSICGRKKHVPTQAD